MVIVSGEPGLAGFIEAKDDGSGDDNWSYKLGKAPVRLSVPTPNFYIVSCNLHCDSCLQTSFRQPAAD